MPRRLSIVIPCFNEEDAIDQVLERVHQAIHQLKKEGLDEVEVIVVDDASTDNSLALLRRWPQVRVINNRQRLNYGGSLKRGFLEAQGDLIAFLDMDGTYDPMQFVPMVRTLFKKQVAVVCGHRLGADTHMPWARWWGNQLFVSLIRLLYRHTVLDSCTGQRLFQRHLLNAFCKLPSNDLQFSLNMTLHCLRHRIPTYEIPIPYDARIGTSKLSLWLDGPRFLRAIVARWLAQIFEERSWV